MTIAYLNRLGGFGLFLKITMKFSRGGLIAPVIQYPNTVIPAKAGHVVKH